VPVLVSIEERRISIPITLVGESQWYAAGPYLSFDEAFEPEQPEILSGAAALGPSAPWRPLSVSEPAVSLLAGLEGDQGTYYLATDLLIGPAREAGGGEGAEGGPSARPGALRLASNDGVAAWLNGQLVPHHTHRPATGAQRRRAPSRSPPAGTAVIKIAQCSPRRFLAVSLRDSAGHLLLPAAAGRDGA
jgi:hypothetical protein